MSDRDPDGHQPDDDYPGIPALFQSVAKQAQLGVIVLAAAFRYDPYYGDELTATRLLYVELARSFFSRRLFGIPPPLPHDAHSKLVHAWIGLAKLPTIYGGRPRTWIWGEYKARWEHMGDVEVRLDDLKTFLQDHGPRLPATLYPTEPSNTYCIVDLRAQKPDLWNEYQSRQREWIQIYEQFDPLDAEDLPPRKQQKAMREKLNELHAALARLEETVFGQASHLAVEELQAPAPTARATQKRQANREAWLKALGEFVGEIKKQVATQDRRWPCRPPGKVLQLCIPCCKEDFQKEFARCYPEFSDFPAPATLVNELPGFGARLNQGYKPNKNNPLAKLLATLKEG